MDKKYTNKVKELELVGQYVSRLGMIESNLSQDVDEGKIDIYVLTLLTNCIDRINRVYIEGEKRYNKDCCEYSARAREELELHNDCNEFGDVSDVLTKDEEFIKANIDVDNLLSDVTQSDESNDNGGI